MIREEHPSRCSACRRSSQSRLPIVHERYGGTRRNRPPRCPGISRHAFHIRRGDNRWRERFEQAVGQDVEDGTFLREADRVIEARSRSRRRREWSWSAPPSLPARGWASACIRRRRRDARAPSAAKAGGLAPCDDVQRFLVEVIPRATPRFGISEVVEIAEAQFGVPHPTARLAHVLHHLAAPTPRSTPIWRRRDRNAFSSLSTMPPYVIVVARILTGDAGFVVAAQLTVSPAEVSGQLKFNLSQGSEHAAVTPPRDPWHSMCRRQHRITHRHVSKRFPLVFRHATVKG